MAARRSRSSATPASPATSTPRGAAAAGWKRLAALARSAPDQYGDLWRLTSGPGIRWSTGARAVEFGAGRPLTLIAGPCVAESRELLVLCAGMLKKLARKHRMQLVFKASYDKANRSSSKSFRGPGKTVGLEWLAATREQFRLPVLTDVHSPEDATLAASFGVDVLQIPAFLCRQTDLLVAAADTGRGVNIKKGQFMAPEDMLQAVEKVRACGNTHVAVTERGTTFGYRNLVVDMRGLAKMRSFAPVIFDATHAVQEPGGKGTSSGGDRSMVATLARAAVAAGVDGLFVETHPDPDRALSDGPNMIPLALMDEFLTQIAALRKTWMQLASQA
ncbi:MAG: 3-deoxy-8-phosphooctulonate synthase [Planctomycetota bacterium]